MQEGAGGKTSVSTGGAQSFEKEAGKRTVYVEFDVPANSLVQGGRNLPGDVWLTAVGPSAQKYWQDAIFKQGGQLLPEVKNISEILAVKIR
jgi:hypothetical protein